MKRYYYKFNRKITVFIPMYFLIQDNISSPTLKFIKTVKTKQIDLRFYALKYIFIFGFVYTSFTQISILRFVLL